jgi:LPS-assembly protein
MGGILTHVSVLRGILATVVVGLGLAVFVTAQAAETSPVKVPSVDSPVELTAEEMSYDRELGVVTATGNVEVSQEDRVLIADTISYNQRQDVLTASGNITLLEPTGEVIFAEYMELSGDLKDGIIRDLRIVLADRSRIAANGGRRSGAEVTEFSKAVYSPCELCQEDPSRPPLWQIKAVKVVHDKSRQIVEYSDAWLELGGMPIAYTPYFYHPDPTVKRRTGLLTPSFGGSSDLGYVTRLPYFININQSVDATLTPFYASDEGPGLAAEYRHVLMDGEVEASGSVARNSGDGYVAHILSSGTFYVDDTWRWGFDLNRVSDDTYLRRYGFGSADTLTSRLYAEGFRRKNYMTADAYVYQGLQSGDDPGDAPIVAPMLSYSHVGEPDAYGGRRNLDASFVALTRTDGVDVRRMSADLGWKLPYIAPAGDVYTLSTSLKGDLYHVNGLARHGQETEFRGFTGRIVPEAALDWRYPFVREEGPVYQLFEPIVSAVVSPYGGNPDTIPNEDSIDFEFDDTNLFSTNRFSGLDRVEGGPRLNYGLKWGVFGQKGGSSTIMVGQSYRPRVDDTFADGSGLEDHFSDLVGKVHFSPGGALDLFYRTRVSKEDLAPKRNEVSLRAGPAALNLNANYVFFDHQEGSEFPGREELSMVVNTELSRYWRASLSGVRDLATNDMRKLGFNLVYEDECFVFSSEIARTFFEDRDLEPTDTIMFRVMFKTLGEVTSGVSQSQ